MGIEAVRRRFGVTVPVETAWARLAEIERWPEWAPHITSVTTDGPGVLHASSKGALHIKGAGRNTFRMSAWDPPRRWEWVGGPRALRVHYDHRFEPEATGGTSMEWVVTLSGPLARVVRPVFAHVYGRNVDQAIPRLQRWIVR